jgi:membrane protein YqaA with SNARE-associated domain
VRRLHVDIFFCHSEKDAIRVLHHDVVRVCFVSLVSAVVGSLVPWFVGFCGLMVRVSLVRGCCNVR